MWPVLSDGTRLYYTSENTLAPTPERRHTLMQVPIGGGQSTPVPISLGDLRTSLFDMSVDGQEVLLGVASKGVLEPRELWTVRLADGLRRRIGSLAALSARLSPDGRWLAYLLDSGVYLASADGTGSRRLVEYHPRPSDQVSWSIDGKRLFLVRSDVRTRRVTGWELRIDGSVLRRVAPEWQVNHGVVGETPKGRHVLLLSSGSLFSIPRNGVGRTGPMEPVRLTQGTPLFFPPVRSSDGRYFTLGSILLGELQRYDPIAKTWRRHLDGISADNVTYSRDGQWVAYIRYPGAILWRCRADGSNCEQLTKPPRRTVIAHWSPDSRTLGASIKDPEKPYRIWLYENSGREPREAAPGHVGTQGDFDWFPSGRKLVIALMGSYNTGEGHYLRVVDLESGKVEKFPGSEGLHSPRWSPDGRMLSGLVALDPQGERLRIFHVSKRAWVPTSNDIVRYPVWAPDSRSILYFSGEAFRRFHVDTGKPETVVEILGEELTGNWFPWSGADASGAPLILRNRNVTQVYELEFLPK
jgi:Tol biopolymer transport system component